MVSPLLTREAVNLLINCVTSKETELWHSLGDAWLVPRSVVNVLPQTTKQNKLFHSSLVHDKLFIFRDQWKGYVAPYHPLFMDGWSPEFPVLDDRDHVSSSVDAKRTHAEEIRAAQQDVCGLRVLVNLLLSCLCQS